MKTKYKIRLRLLMFFCGYSFLPFEAIGQLSEVDTARWEWSIGSTGYFSSGNVERLLITANASVKHRMPNFGYINTSRYKYGTFGNFRTDDDILSQNYFYLWPDNKFYPFQMTWVDRSWQREIDVRWLIGLGLSWRMWYNSNHLLKSSFFSGYEHSLFFRDEFAPVAPPTTGRRIKSHRWGGRLFGRHSIFQSHLKFVYEFWYLGAFNQQNNFRYHYRLELLLPIVQSIYFNIQLVNDYERLVPAEVQQQDRVVKFGLRWLPKAVN